MQTSLAQTTYYVNDDASGVNNGTSWTDAYTNLQSAISASSLGDEIWVAAGTYKPTTTTDRNISFELPDSVKLYGGFNGVETSISERNNHGIGELNEVILSGDIGTLGDVSDNTDHVVKCVNDNYVLYLNGFTITEGYGTTSMVGGGMYLQPPSNATGQMTLDIISCNFIKNTASWDGANLHSIFCDINMEDVIFSEGNGNEDGSGFIIAEGNATLNNVQSYNNQAAWTGVGGVFSNVSMQVSNSVFKGNSMTRADRPYGGGLYVYNSSGSFSNCVFSGNYSQAYGGGIFFNIFNSTHTVDFTNCTLTGNKASTSGGGVYVYPSGYSNMLTLNFKNTVIWNNIDATGTITASSSIETSSAIVSYENCLIQGLNPGGTNLDGLTNAAFTNYPGFSTVLDPSSAPSVAGDFNISNGSPLLLAGTAIGAPTEDFNGLIRPSTPSIGAFDFILVENALDFDGIDDYVLVNDNSITTDADNITIETWYQFETIPTTDKKLIMRGDDANGGWSLALDHRIDNTISGNAYCSAGNGAYAHSTQTIEPNVWNHLVLTWERSSGVSKLYINGVLEATELASTPADLRSSSIGFVFGKGNIASEQMEGQLDDIRIWNIAKTECEIQQAYHTRLTGTEPNLVAYYDMNEGIANGDNGSMTTLTDLVSNTDGTLNGFTLDGSTSNFVTSTTGVITFAQFEDLTAPVPDAESLITISDECSVSAPSPPTATDACEGTITGTTATVFPVTAQATTVVTWTYDDGNGNSITQDQNIIINDITPPTAVCDSFTVQLDASGAASIDSADVDGGSTDNCGIATLSLDITDFGCNDLGTNDVTVTVADIYGNSDFCTSTVTVEDDIDPIAVAHDTTLYLNSDGFAYLSAASIDDSSTDNCSIDTMYFSRDTFDCSDLTSPDNIALRFDGVNDYVNVDKAVIPTTGDFTIMVWSKSTPGQTAYREVISQIGTNGSFYIGKNSNGTIRISDSWKNTSIQFPQDGEWHNFAVVKTSTNTLLYVDGELKAEKGSAIYNPTGNNFRIARQYGTYEEYMNGDIDEISVWNTAKNITEINQLITNSPLGIEIDLMAYYNMESVGSTVLPDLSGNGNDGMLINMDVNNVWVNSPIEDYIQPFAVTLTVADACTNSASCMATITLLDTIAPTALCRMDTMDVLLDRLGMSSITSGDIDAGSSDNCTLQNIAIDQSDFKCAEVGYTIVVLTALDKAGNTSTCNSVINVIDDVKPLALCRDTTIYLDKTGNVSIDSSHVNNSSSDVCGIATMNLDISNFDCSDIGPNPVVMTVTDVNGNFSTCNSVVTIADTVPPTLICHNQDTTIYLDTEGKASIDTGFMYVDSDDACGVADISLNKSSFDGSNVGANEVTLSVTDVNGNFSTCTSTVTVKDTIAPVALCHNIGIALDEEGRAKVYPAFIDDGSTDEGGIVSYSLDVSRFTCADVGPNTVVLSVRDVGGNVSSCSATVTVNDSWLPEVACKDVEVSLNAEGIAVIDSSMIDNGSSAMCGISGIELSQSIFTGANLGKNSITMTVANRSGVTASCETTVTVKDEIAPVANCNSIDVWLSDSSVYELSVADVLMLAKGSSDNATPSDSLQIEVTPTTFDCSNIGDSVAVEVRITDQAGNESSCEAMVYVKDSIGIQLGSLPDIEISLAAGVCETAIDYPEVFAAKPCATFTQLEGLGADGLFPVGKTVETWEATNGTVADTVSFSIIVNSENAVPTIDSIANVTANEDETPVPVVLSGISGGNDCTVQDVTVTATNKNTALVTGINVSYTAVDSAWVLNVALAENESGTDSITVVVEDSEGAKISRMFALEVAPVNDAPVLVTQLEDVELTANDTFSISIPTILGTVFDDIDDATLVYTLTMTDTKDAPTWLSVSELDNELLIGLHPLQSDTGCYDVMLEATDAAGATVTDTFEVCVEELLTGIYENNNSGFEFTMYPNPSRGMVSLDVTTSFTGEAELYVMSITGQQVFHKTYLSNVRIKFDLRDQVSGSYLVILQVEGKRTVKKLILDRK